MSGIESPSEAVTYVTDSGPITISQESVFQEYMAIEAMTKDLAARQARFAKLIDYLRAEGRDAWVPPDVDDVLLPLISRGVPPASSGTWTSEILKELAAFPDGVALIDLLEVIKNGPIGERARRNRNGIYNAATKLEQTHRIVKHKGRVFLPRLYEAFRERVQSGEVEEFEKGKLGKKTAVDTLTEFISSRPDGVEAGEIVTAMKAEGLSAGTVYNNLSKVLQRDRVRREGKVYLPLNSEAPADLLAGASKVTDDEVAASSSNMDPGND